MGILRERIPSTAALTTKRGPLRAASPQTTKPSARHRRSAECVLRSVVGTEAYGFIRRRSAVRTSSSFAAPTGTNAVRGADTKTSRVLRRNTKTLRGFSRTVSLRKSSVCSVVDLQTRLYRLTRSHGGTEFQRGVSREKGVSLFVNRRESEPFSWLRIAPWFENVVR